MSTNNLGVATKQNDSIDPQEGIELRYLLEEISKYVTTVHEKVSTENLKKRSLEQLMTKKLYQNNVILEDSGHMISKYLKM